MTNEITSSATRSCHFDACGWIEHVAQACHMTSYSLHIKKEKMLFAYYNCKRFLYMIIFSLISWNSSFQDLFLDLYLRADIQKCKRFRSGDFRRTFYFRCWESRRDLFELICNWNKLLHVFRSFSIQVTKSSRVNR